ncbi:MAG: queuine tRNA-ribosyltransferase family protein [Marinilabiliales bacterium]|nr:queuine tRNA-ribosyltransferase family protein [Marinilabiliales bacterium]
MGWNNQYKEQDGGPRISHLLDARSKSEISRSYSKAYLRHLVISGEMLGAQIATMHNLSFYNSLVNEARKKIMEGTFGTWKKEILQKLSERA